MWDQIIAIGGTAASIYGGYSAAENAKKYGKAQAAEYERVAKANAELSRRDAKTAERIAASRRNITGWQVNKQLQDLDAFIGQQAAGFASRGVVVSTGSALDVMANSYKEGMIDAAQIQYNGDMSVKEAENLRDRYYTLAENGMADGAAAASLASLEGNILANNIRWKSISENISTGLDFAYKYGYL